MKVLRIILKKLLEVLALLKMLDTEFRKIKRQKFILLTILAACLFPIPLTVVIVHAKLNYDVLLMFVMEFGFFFWFFPLFWVLLRQSCSEWKMKMGH